MIVIMFVQSNFLTLPIYLCNMFLRQKINSIFVCCYRKYPLFENFFLIRTQFSSIKKGRFYSFDDLSVFFSRFFWRFFLGLKLLPVEKLLIFESPVNDNKVFFSLDIKVMFNSDWLTQIGIDYGHSIDQLLPDELENLTALQRTQLMLILSDWLFMAEHHSCSVQIFDKSIKQEWLTLACSKMTSGRFRTKAFAFKFKSCINKTSTKFSKINLLR